MPPRAECTCRHLQRMHVHGALVVRLPSTCSNCCNSRASGVQVVPLIKGFAEQHFGSLSNVEVLQDGAPQHANAALVLSEGASPLLTSHPASSPDLNPIEHCWVDVSRALRGFVLPLAYSSNRPCASTQQAGKAGGLLATPADAERMLRTALELAWAQGCPERARAAVLQLPAVMEKVHADPHKLQRASPRVE